MTNTTTVTTTILGYYTGISYGAASDPTSTAASDHITRAQNFINERWPNVSQNLHDFAVIDCCRNFHAMFKQSKEGQGGASYSGADKSSMSFQPQYFQSREVQEMLNMAERKTNPIISTFDLHSATP